MFKKFNEESVNLYEFVSNKSYNKNQTSITRYAFVSGSSDETLSRNYNFARINLYLSGSEYSQGYKRYNTYPTPGNRLNQDNMFFNKFYVSGSVLSIPQNEFGDKIKPGTFTLTDNSTATEIRIVDDLNGNLYAPSAPSSSDSNLSLSSSANYVGNIFYELGVFTIVETGSFDGTNNYSEVTSGNFTVNYKGVHNLTTFEYVCTALPNEVNQTQNMSIFKASAGKLKDNLTGSLFPTYVTEVGLYDDAEDLIGIARLSKPIPKSRKIPMRFFIRMDY